jgi:hypothetical protein
MNRLVITLEPPLVAFVPSVPFVPSAVAKK